MLGASFLSKLLQCPKTPLSSYLAQAAVSLYSVGFIIFCITIIQCSPFFYLVGNHHSLCTNSVHLQPLTHLVYGRHFGAHKYLQGFQPTKNRMKMSDIVMNTVQLCVCIYIYILLRYVPSPHQMESVEGNAEIGTT